LSFLGVHYGVVMDALLSDETLDVPAAAEKITALFSRSLQRTEPDDDPVERPRRTRLTAPERRKQILAAAREVFLQYGLSGTRMRHIAGKAGLTEAGLYAHFASKDEIYREAVTEPLERLVDQFVSRTLVLSRSEGVSREAIMLQANEELLACMVELTPLLAVALFSEMGKGQEFYREVFLPKLEIATRSLVEGIYGRDAPVEDFDVVVEAMLGVHFGVALDHLMRGTPVDIPKVAARLTRMIQLDGGTTDTSS
jgi:AcrR family transcriptional regulator